MIKTIISTGLSDHNNNTSYGTKESSRLRTSVMILWRVRHEKRENFNFSLFRSPPIGKTITRLKPHRLPADTIRGYDGYRAVRVRSIPRYTIGPARENVTLIRRPYGYSLRVCRSHCERELSKGARRVSSSSSPPSNAPSVTRENTEPPENT